VIARGGAQRAKPRVSNQITNSFSRFARRTFCGISGSTPFRLCFLLFPIIPITTTNLNRRRGKNPDSERAKGPHYESLGQSTQCAAPGKTSKTTPTSPVWAGQNNPIYFLRQCAGTFQKATWNVSSLNPDEEQSFPQLRTIRRQILSRKSTPFTDCAFCYLSKDY
jgi:hypothetical protein